MQEQTTVRWVLVVDDDPVHRLLMRDSVEQAVAPPTRVLEAPDGPTAQGLLARLPLGDVFLITDRHMPGSPGGEELLHVALAHGAQGTLVTGRPDGIDPSLPWLHKPTTYSEWHHVGLAAAAWEHRRPRAPERPPHPVIPA